MMHQLGRTGLRISRIALGTVNFGGRVDENDAHRLMDHAVERGVNLIDTADMYGWRVYKGWTEEVVGRWLAKQPGRRDRIVVATKVGNPTGTDPNDEGLSARHIIAACEASLRRLGTDWIDLYQMHRIDHRVGWDEIWQAMDQLVQQGKVRYVGSSNFAGADLVTAQHLASARGRLGIAAEQCLYNLSVRQAELEILPAAARLGIGVLVWSPLHGGLLAGVLRKLAEGRAVKSAQGRAAQALPQRRDTVERYERLCAEFGEDPAVIGMAWALRHPAVTALVAGPRTEAQLDGAVRATERLLTAEECDRLDELFPPTGRGGSGPDAWIS
jgi:NDP-hexose 2,3-enoyl reductase